MKVCRTCNKSKKLTDFHSHKSCAQGVRPDCKECMLPIYKAKQIKYLRENPEKRRLTIIKTRFGLTETQYTEMFTQQNQCCAICKTTNPGAGKKYFSIDHCHTTNQIRGILCHGCNAGLGMFKDDPSFLLAAVEYLKGNK